MCVAQAEQNCEMQQQMYQLSKIDASLRSDCINATGL